MDACGVRVRGRLRTCVPGLARLSWGQGCGHAGRRLCGVAARIAGPAGRELGGGRHGVGLCRPVLDRRGPRHARLSTAAGWRPFHAAAGFRAGHRGARRLHASRQCPAHACRHRAARAQIVAVRTPRRYPKCLRPPSDHSPLPQRVFQRLDDQRFQSGEVLAEDLGVTRAAVWKAVEQLRELGVALDAQTNRGYRLANGVTALAPGRIEAILGSEVRERIEALIVDWTLESTNTRLLESFAPSAGKAAVVLAEHQTGGRGRRGRSWVAPPGGAICISVSWQYVDMPADLSALSLVVGLSAVHALPGLGITGVQLKWPNDLVTEQGKLGGILIEMRAEAAGPVHVVVGVGLNVMLDEAARAAVAATGNVADDIRAHLPAVPDRNAIVAALLAYLVPALESFPRRTHAASRELERQRRAAGSRSSHREPGRDHARCRARHRLARRVARGNSRRHAPLHLRGSHGASRTMTTLLVDMGNTRVKWALLRGERLSRMRALAHGRRPAECMRVRVVMRRRRVTSRASSRFPWPARLSNARWRRARRRFRVHVEFVRTSRTPPGCAMAIVTPGAWAPIAGWASSPLMLQSARAGQC